MHSCYPHPFFLLSAPLFCVMNTSTEAVLPCIVFCILFSASDVSKVYGNHNPHFNYLANTRPLKIWLRSCWFHPRQPRCLEPRADDVPSGCHSPGHYEALRDAHEDSCLIRPCASSLLTLCHFSSLSRELGIQTDVVIRLMLFSVSASAFVVLDSLIYVQMQFYAACTYTLSMLHSCLHIYQLSIVSYPSRHGISYNFMKDKFAQ